MNDDDGSRSNEPITHGWHLDKRVPITIVFMLMVQTAALIIYITRLDARVEYLERRVIVSEQTDLRAATAERALSTQLTRIEERVEMLLERGRIEEQR